MKTLLLLRHAKSSWKDKSLDDHERPLNDRGKKEAPRMGRLLRDQNLLPDLIVGSDAKRCRRTVEKIAEAADYHGETILSGNLYLASPDNYVHCLNRLSDEHGCVLVVGHNPGLEELLESLIRQYEPLTTAALAHLELPALEKWSDLRLDSDGRLVRLWQPMDVA